MAYIRMGERAEANFEERFRDGYRYVIDRVHPNGTKYMICCGSHRFNCRGRMIIYANGDSRLTHGHTHPRDENEEHGFFFRLALFNAAVTRFDNPRVLYDEVVLQHPQGASQYPFDKASQASIRRWRRKVRPPTPRSFSDLIDFLTSEDWRQCLSMDTVNMTAIKVGEPGFRSLLLYDPRFIRTFESTDYLLVDGTFGTVPRIYQVIPNIGGISQLYIIMGQKYDCVLPLFWILMESKTREAYGHVFAAVKRVMPHLRPISIMSDYERPAQDALHDIFPTSMIHGCYFHFVKANTQFIQGHRELRNLNRTSDEANLFIKKMKVLPLLPPEEITPTFLRAVDNLSPPCAAGLQLYINYFQRQWLQVVGPAVLSVCGMLRRTNNNCEALNRILRDRLGENPSLWTFLRQLLILQNRTKTDLQNLEQQGRARNTPLVQYVMNNQVLVHTWMLMEEGRISIDEALDIFMNNVNNIADVINLYYVIIDENDANEENESNADTEILENENDSIIVPVQRNTVNIGNANGNEHDTSSENAPVHNAGIPVFAIINQSYDRDCIICRENESCIVFMPCKHTISCAACMNSLVDTAEEEGRRLTCPFCRSFVMEAIRIKGTENALQNTQDSTRPNADHNREIPTFSTANNTLDHLCKICHRRQPEVLFMPCKHRISCTTCVNALRNIAENDNCRLLCLSCAAPVEEAHRTVMPCL